MTHNCPSLYITAGSEEWWKGRWKGSGSNNNNNNKVVHPGADGAAAAAVAAGASSSEPAGSRTLNIEVWSSQSRVVVNVDGATVMVFFTFEYYYYGSLRREKADVTVKGLVHYM